MTAKDANSEWFAVVKDWPVIVLVPANVWERSSFDPLWYSYVVLPCP